MLTRGSVSHQYGHCPGAVPPFHAVGLAHVSNVASMRPRGGLLGGAVSLNMPAGNWGQTGYGYLGMDPTDPASWPRPFVPTAGMIGRREVWFRDPG